MKIQYFQVDAFSSRVFSGNPAGVCPLEQWLDDEVMQAIAAENNLSETAFFVPSQTGYDLRWFTPELEVDLCGHATLASAYVLFNQLGVQADQVRFSSRGGDLSVSREDDFLYLNFPSRNPVPCKPPDGLNNILGAEPVEVLESRDLVVVFEDEQTIREMKPDLKAISALETFAVIVTAPGSDSDFVSRFFAPRAGIPEDPVTGSAHCSLTPYWARRLGRNRLNALQVSKRGGELFCEDHGDRVSIGGRAALFMTGTVHLEAAPPS